MLKVIVKLKKLWNLSQQIERYEKQHKELYELITDKTTVQTDVHYQGNLHNIIVVGRYLNQDYVRLFNVRSDSFTDIVDMLARIEKGSHIGRFDIPHNYPDVTAVINRDRF